jgi:hypothetical protein
MGTLVSTDQAPPSWEVLPGFDPLHQMWEGAQPPFPSENSARWAIRQHRAALIDAGALALHMGRTFVHRERLLEVLRLRALAAYKERHSDSCRDQ